MTLASNTILSLDLLAKEMFKSKMAQRFPDTDNWAGKVVIKERQKCRMNRMTLSENWLLGGSKSSWALSFGSYGLYFRLKYNHGVTVGLVIFGGITYTHIES